MTEPLPRIILGDTETTGLPPKGWKLGDPFPESYRCVEMAWIEIEEQDGELVVLDRRESFTDPETPIPEALTAIHGITDKDVWTAPTLAELKAQLGDEYTSRPTVLIAHNAKFDIPFFKEVLNIQSTFCTLALVRHMLPQLPNHKLGTIREALGVVSDKAAHRAMADLDVLLESLRLLLKMQGGRALRDHLNTPVRMLALMPFGKFKGMPFLSLPKPYRNWLLYEAGDIPDDVRYTLEKIKDL